MNYTKILFADFFYIRSISESWAESQQCYCSLLKFFPSSRFFNTLLSPWYPGIMFKGEGNSVIFWIFFISFPLSSKIIIPLRPIKFLSPQAECKTIFKKYPHGIWGGSYSKHCLLGNLKGILTSSISFWFDYSPLVPGLWNPSTVFLKITVYSFLPSYSWQSQSLFIIFFIIATLLVKRRFSQDLNSSSIEEEIIFRISPRKIKQSSNNIFIFLIPIIDWIRSPM